MRILVTGSAGFLGRALVSRLALRPMAAEQSLLLVDAGPTEPVDGAGIVAGDLGSEPVRRAVAAFRPELVFHLAAVPGGASEADPELSRRVNLDAAIDLLAAVGSASSRPRFVYASSIAVFGAPLPNPVDDDTVARPTLTYGAHKLMVETALADATRRGLVWGLALRLPGLVARPPAAAGLKSAFMSDLFHALRAGRSMTMPVGAEGWLWVMSLERCVDNLVRAAEVAADAPSWPAVTAPALRTRVGDLVAAISGAVGADAEALVTYAPDPGLEAQFAAYPPLRTPAADALGLRHDGDVQALVHRVLAQLDGFGGGAA